MAKKKDVKEEVKEEVKKVDTDPIPMGLRIRSKK